MKNERNPYDLSPEGRDQLEGELYDLLLKQVERFIEGEDQASSLVSSLMRTFEGAVRDAQDRQRADIPPVVAQEPEPAEPPPEIPVEQVEMTTIDLPEAETRTPESEPPTVDVDMRAQENLLDADVEPAPVTQTPTSSEQLQITMDDPVVDLVQAIKDGRDDIPELPRPEPVEIPVQVPREFDTPVSPANREAGEGFLPPPDIPIEVVEIDEPPTSPTPDEPALTGKIKEMEESLERFLTTVSDTLGRMSVRIYDLERQADNWRSV